MKNNNKATKNCYLKEPSCNHGNNALNKCSSYFDISQIKQLYAPQSANGYEQIFSPPRKAKKAGRKSKKEIFNTKGAIPSFHSDQYQNDTKTPVPVGIGERKKMKFNAPNEDPHFFYSNSFDQTPRKHFSFNDADPQNEESPNLYNPSGSVRKGANKKAISRNASLNKYDFIRFVCSPTKKSVDNRSAKCDSERGTPAKNGTSGNAAKNDRKKGAKYGEHTAANMGSTNDPKRVVKNYPQWENIFDPKNDPKNGAKNDHKNYPQNDRKKGGNYGEHTAANVGSTNDPKGVVKNYPQWENIFDPKRDAQNASKTDQKFDPQNDRKKGGNYGEHTAASIGSTNDPKGAVNNYPKWENIFDPKRHPQNASKIDQKFDPQNDRKKGGNYGEHTAANVGYTNDPKGVVNNYPQWDQFFDPTREHQSASKTEQNFHPQSDLKGGVLYAQNVTQNNDSKNDAKGAHNSCPQWNQFFQPTREHQSTSKTEQIFYPQSDLKGGVVYAQKTAQSNDAKNDAKGTQNSCPQWDQFFDPRRDPQNALRTNQMFDPQSDRKGGAAYTQNVTQNNDTKNDAKGTQNGCPKWDLFSDPTGEHQSDSKTEQFFVPQSDFKGGVVYAQNVTHNNDAKIYAKCATFRVTKSYPQNDPKWDPKNAPKTDPQNESIFDPKRGANCGERVGTNGATNDDTGEDPQSGIKNWPKNDLQSDIKSCPKNDPQNGINNGPNNYPQSGINNGPKSYPQRGINNDPQNDLKTSQHFPLQNASQSGIKNCPNNYPPNGASNSPPNDPHDGSNQSSGNSQESTPQNGAQNNGLIDLDSHDSIDRLSRNFFINNKKIFLTHFRKDKEAHITRASSHAHSSGGNVPLRYETPEGGRNEGKNEHSKWGENAEGVTPCGETSQWGLFAKGNSPHFEDYIQRGEKSGGVENCSRGSYYSGWNHRIGENQTAHDDCHEDDEHHNHDARYSEEEPADGSNFLQDMNSFVRKNCNVTKSLYSHLDVPYNGSKAEIKKAYKEKIKVHHPDKGGSINKFLQLKLSYDILTNDKKRKMYDKYGHSILELLVSEKFQNYEICSSEEENCENEIDEENLKVYDLFVQKYNNTSYLHNLSDLKMDGYQYNDFQKLIFHFFNDENPMFKNTFHLFPAYSPAVPPYRRKKANQRKADKKRAAEKGAGEEAEKEANKQADIGKIPRLEFPSSLENSPNRSARTNELLSPAGSSTSRNDSPSNCSETKESSIYDVLNAGHVTNLFNEMDDDFKYFYKKCIVHKIEESEQANNARYGKKGATKSVSRRDGHHVEGEANGDDASTPVKEHTHHPAKEHTHHPAKEHTHHPAKEHTHHPAKEHTHHPAKEHTHHPAKEHVERPFEQPSYDEDAATPLAQCQLSQEKHTSNRRSRNEETAHSFRDIQTSPIAYKIINENDERHIAEFYRWFELFFSHHQGAQPESEAANEAEYETTNETANEVANHATQGDRRICSDVPPGTQEETHSAQTDVADVEINSEPFRTFQYCAEKFCAFGQTLRSSNDTPNGRVNGDAPNGRSPAKFAHNSGKTEHCNGGKTKHFNGDKPSRPREEKAHRGTPPRSSAKAEDNHLTINIEEKYGFNLLKKSEQKIKDITHDFNYIYIGSNMMKKNKFILFVKEESIKKFFKIKLLIEKIKKKSNLKLISAFEKEIEKNIKHMEYILLLTTHRDEFLPLNDFYLLDRNAFAKELYCIPIYVKKNSISRPTHFHIRWIVYTIQSLIFFNFFFKKVNKYMCAFPFFNYKYNLLKHFLGHEEKANSIHHQVKNFYIFFQQYILKNKHHYLKYFPHSIIVHLKNDASQDDQSKKPVRVNMSSILVLTSNKHTPSAEW
ncbi:DnaJ protein, putative [Plasmodium vivax]|uniref:DnaJ protein, putative n=1 Tax=Plasmodium vivax TaxID=5855 RepID=A0A564ZUF3_PLAVI|nr:DnaJ protein, putative [Plasmodium vivax]